MVYGPNRIYIYCFKTLLRFDALPLFVRRFFSCQLSQRSHPCMHACAHSFHFLVCQHDTVTPPLRAAMRGGRGGPLAPHVCCTLLVERVVKCTCGLTLDAAGMRFYLFLDLILWVVDAESVGE